MVRVNTKLGVIFVYLIFVVLEIFFWVVMFGWFFTTGH